MWRVLQRLSSPEVITLAEDQVGFCEEIGADLAETAAATTALETIFVPVGLQSLNYSIELNKVIERRGGDCAERLPGGGSDL